MPSGGSNAGHKNAKKKSKAQLEKELKKQTGSGSLVQPMTFEVVKPKRKEREW